MVHRFVFSLIALSPFAVAQVQLLVGGQGPAYTRVLQLQNGDQLLVGTSQAEGTPGPCCTPHNQISLTALGSAPFHDLPPDVGPRIGGGGNDEPTDAAVDPSGNVWIVGSTDSDDFNLVNPIITQKVPYRAAGFVIELDPTGNKLLFATYLGGKLAPTNTSFEYFTETTAIAIDGGGNVYVGGTTNETDFPTTPGAYLGGRGGADEFLNTYFYSFLVKISPAGKLIYGTELGTGFAECIGGSACLGAESTWASVSGIVPVSAGVAAVATTSGPEGGVSVMEVAADGSKLVWTNPVHLGFGNVYGLSMVQDASGNLDLFGGYETGGLVVNGMQVEPPSLGLFAAQLKPDGSVLNYAFDLGQSAVVRAAGLLLDASGNEYLIGTNSSPQFPTLAGVPNLGPDFVLQLDPSGTAAQKLFRFPRGTISGPPAFDASGNLLLLGSGSALLTLPPTYAFDLPAIVALANPASNVLNTGLNPGALLTLYGFDLPDSTTGMQVLIDGTPAPLLFAGGTQINLQVPFEVSATSNPDHTLKVVTPSGSASIDVSLGQSLGIFTTDGSHAAALNQDGTVNSKSNPAPSGSIVSLFGTGAAWPKGSQDGAAPATAIPWDPSLNRFEMVDSNETPLNILYAGNAPGLVDGVFQMNVQLLPAIPSSVGGFYGFTLQATPFLNNSLSANVVQLYIK